MKIMLEKKLLQDQKERSVLFVGFLVVMGTAIMLIPWFFSFKIGTCLQTRYDIFYENID